LDRAALEALYHATDGPNWRNNAGWLTDAPFNHWYGVSVGAEGRVETLTLYDNLLSGQLPPAVGDLTNLALLSLDGNLLSGPLPAELGNLANLQSLVLNNNRLSGPNSPLSPPSR
jgi:Leucine-rich repeat (LRR) protein